MKNFKTNEKGFSLLELLLVIGVGALLLLAGLATYRIVTEGNNVNEAVRLLNSTKIGIQNLYQNQSSYGTNGTAITDIIIEGGVFPARNIVGSNALDPWRNPITVTPVNDSNFTIELTDVPESACLKLGTAFTPTTDSDFVSVDINSGGADTDPTVQDAQAACDGPSNDIVWEFL